MASADPQFLPQHQFRSGGNEKNLPSMDYLENHEHPESDIATEDICRVCRGTSQPDRPLFHPCQCTGSIKYVHQDCLVEWLKHSGKQMCELCQYRFQFAPIFRPDMPQTLSISDLVVGLTKSMLENVRHWMHLAFVSLMWLFFVPTCIYRIYKFLMYGSMWSVIKLPLEIFALEDIFFDCIHGLLVVVVSLLGFISMVWLKDQLGHGLGPNWLEEDRQEVNRVAMREAQERVQLLQRHLEEAGARALERQVVPDRVAVAAELSSLHDKLAVEFNKLANILHSKFTMKLRDLWKQEMEITHSLHGSLLSYTNILHKARRKKYRRLQQWQSNHTGAVPTDQELGLNFQESVVLMLQDKPPPQQLSREAQLSLEEELQQVRASQLKLMKETYSYCSELCKCMSMKFKVTPQGDQEVEDSRVSINLEQIANSSLDEEEKGILSQIWVLKEHIKISAKRESVIIGRQHHEEVVRREVVEARMNRWYNRLLNRHQDDPLVLARRQRRNNRRPNIGRAIAGLARDRPLDGEDVGDNIDELTWARLLGLDGSFRFLEHVIWLICLNSALILGFVYLPFQVGYFTASLFSFWAITGIVNWTGITSVFIGYCVFCVIVLGFYYATGRLHKPKIKNAMGITFISIKVGMILAVEAGIFPLMCGWWIDICSFSFFNSTLAIRQDSMSRAPGTVMFLHWLAGMIFIFYLASFVMLLREVLRPGVLWFLRNLNDQNFHPINEMINLPLQRHIRRFLMSCILFGVCVMVVLLLPSKIIPLLSATFLPYKFSLTNTVSPIREIQIELILLQFIIPTLLEHGNCRAGFKSIMEKWAHVAAWLFGLHSYLLDKSQTGGDIVDVHGRVLRKIPFGSGRDGPVFTGRPQVIGPGFAPFKPYLRPNYFYLRLAGFLVYTVITTVIFSTIILTLPVAIGRTSLRLVGLVDAPEMYTASIGLFLFWIALRLLVAIVPHAALGVLAFLKQMVSWTVLMLKCLCAGFFLFVVIPLFMGHLVELVLLSPLRVPVNKLPVFYPSSEWALGLLHTKCVCGLIWLMDFHFKHTLDTVYQAGIRNINLTFILVKVTWPVIAILSLTIAVPYIFFMGIMYSCGFLSYQNSVIGYRYFFPSSLLLLIIVGLGRFVYIQCSKLYNHVRNEKYLIGRQLVNFEGLQSQEL